MAFIKLPDIDQVEAPIKKQFEELKATIGEIEETARILAVRPDIFSATTNIVGTLLMRETELAHNIKESIAILISLENSCSMCVGEHRRIAEILGMTEEQIDEVQGGVESMNIPEREKKLLRLCLKSAGESYKITQGDVDVVKEAGYSDSQILEAAAIVGYFNYINTIANAMGAGK